jgi:hypothetical protein
MPDASRSTSGEGGGFAGIGVELRAAEGGSEDGRADGDDRPQAAGVVAGVDDELVAILGHGFEDRRIRVIAHAATI